MKTKSAKTVFEGVYVKGKRSKNLKQPWTNEKLSMGFPKPSPKKKTKKIINRIKKTPLAKLKREADKFCGDIVRSRGKCEAVGFAVKCSGHLQWAHIISRRYHALRWIPQNALCLCHTHHSAFHYNDEKWVYFLMMYYKDTYVWLYDKRKEYVKIDRKFMEDTIRMLKTYEN